MPLDSQQLLRLSKGQLDDLFAKSPAGELPDGEGIGTALLFPGSFLVLIFAWFERRFLWQGDVFHAKEGYLRSRISPFSFQAMSAKVYKDLSKLDQKECIVMDFSMSLPVPRGIRDELRQVAPALYLGRTVVGGGERSSLPLVSKATGTVLCFRWFHHGLRPINVPFDNRASTR